MSDAGAVRGEGADDRLFEAIGRNDEQALLASLREGANPDAGWAGARWVDDQELPRALHYALRRGWDRGVQALLEAGADPEGKSLGPRGGRAALCWAQSEPGARALIEAGADPGVRGRDGQSVAMRLAAHLKGPQALSFFTLCLDRGYDMEQKDDAGRTALAWAADRLNAEAVAALLSLGCDPNSRDKEGAGMLRGPAESMARGRVMWARGKKVARALIFAGADPLARDAKGGLPEARLAYAAGPEAARAWRELVQSLQEEKERREIKAGVGRRGRKGPGAKRI